LYCELFWPVFLGLLFGIVVGCLPGLTATMAMVLAIPFTYGQPTDVALAFMLGLYCSAVYGGSISAVLVNTPGTPASAATVLDGYPMARKGKAGEALGISAISSSVGGVVSAILLMLLAPQIARFALNFGPHEYFALGFAGLTIIMSVSGDSLLRGFVSGVLGFFLSVIGMDELSGYSRFTFGSLELLGGLSFVPVMIGLFAMSEVLTTVEGYFQKKGGVRTTVSNLIRLPSAGQILSLTRSIIKSSLIGTGIGVIPGAGATIASFVAYNEAKRSSPTPERFGQGSEEGVASAEAAKSAVTGGALIPMLTLGIPGDAVTAVLLGGMVIHGLRPGPLFFVEQGDLVRTIFVILIISNLMMVLLGLLGVRFLALILKVPRAVLTPLISVLCVVGAFSLSNNMFEVWVMLVSGVAGYMLRKLSFPVAPVILGLILGPMVEVNLRRALIMSEGSFSGFFTRPICLTLILVSILSVSYGLRKGSIEKNRQNHQED
jgi:putative tricarboxylic transport membrane protein